MNFDQPTNPESKITPENKIKKGVDFVFEQNPELEKIGTKELYSEYLDTVFPDSKVKDIVYHGTPKRFNVDDFDLDRGGMSGRNFGKGINTTLNIHHAKDYVVGKKEGKIISLILNIKNPLITCNHYKDFHGAHYCIPHNKKITDYINNDSVINYEYLDRDDLKKISDYFIEYVGEKDKNGFPVYQKNIRTNPEIREIIVPELEQACFLGSKQDIENFKNFVSENKEK